MEWPITNTIGSCWCGHSSVFHGIDQSSDRCIECQCVGYTKDTWEQQNTEINTDLKKEI
jgi:hypothetical protein